MKRRIALVLRSTNRIAYAIFFLPHRLLSRRSVLAMSARTSCEPARRLSMGGYSRIGATSPALLLDVESRPQTLDQRAQLRTARVNGGGPEERPLNLPV